MFDIWMANIIQQFTNEIWIINKKKRDLQIQQKTMSTSFKNTFKNSYINNGI